MSNASTYCLEQVFGGDAFVALCHRTVRAHQDLGCAAGPAAERAMYHRGARRVALRADVIAHVARRRRLSDRAEPWQRTRPADANLALKLHL